MISLTDEIKEVSGDGYATGGNEPDTYKDSYTPSPVPERIYYRFTFVGHENLILWVGVDRISPFQALELHVPFTGYKPDADPHPENRIMVNMDQVLFFHEIKYPEPF